MFPSQHEIEELQDVIEALYSQRAAISQNQLLASLDGTLAPEDIILQQHAEQRLAGIDERIQRLEDQIHERELKERHAHHNLVGTEGYVKRLLNNRQKYGDLLLGNPFLFSVMQRKIQEIDDEIKRCLHPESV